MAEQDNYGMVKCELCGSRMKASKITEHMKKVNPKGVTTHEERAKIQHRRAAGKNMAMYAVLVTIIVLGGVPDSGNNRQFFSTLNCSASMELGFCTEMRSHFSVVLRGTGLKVVFLFGAEEINLPDSFFDFSSALKIFPNHLPRKLDINI